MAEECFRYRLEWSETNGWVSASQLPTRRLSDTCSPIFSSNFIVPMQVPAALRTDA